MGDRAGLRQARGRTPQYNTKVMAYWPGRHFLYNLVERRSLLVQLVRRDFEQRFVGSAAGWLWGLIHPLVLLASWTFVFQTCLKVRLPPSEITQNYTLFLFAGFLPWLLFQDTVQRSAACLLEHKGLITKTLFPAELAPVSIFLSSLINHLMALVLAVGAIGVWGGHFGPGILVLPVYMLLLGLFAVGLGWVVSSLNVYLRDTAHVLLVGLTAWFWLTPIFITKEQIPPHLLWLIRLNPMTHFVEAYRERLLTDLPVNLRELGALCAAALIMFALGGLFFRHLKRGFADVL
jgi:lipopolysaccharide transport system permease protein